MKALVLAGGKGTRLRPLTSTLAKQVIPVANRPIIHYVMDNLQGAGIGDVGVVIAPETGHQIREALKPNPWELDITFLPQDQPRGLAHAVVIAKDFLGDDSFIMYLGDNLIGGTVTEFVRSFESSGADAAVTLKRVSDPSHFGVAVMGDDGALKRFVEKPQTPISDLALVGIYCFSSAVHSAVRSIKPSWRGELEITDAIQHLLNHGSRIIGHELDTWWHDCGQKDDLLAANRAILDKRGERRISGSVDSASRSEGNVVVETGAAITRSRVIGPAIVGTGARVTDSVIGPYASIAGGCVVSQSTVTNSILLERATIEGLERVEGSIIGEEARVSRSHNGGMRVMLGGGSQVFL